MQPTPDKAPASAGRARKKIKKKLFYSALLVGLLLMLSLFFNVFHLYNNLQDAQTSLSRIYSPLDQSALCDAQPAEMPLLSTLSFNKPH
ncbi:Uncharacterised protein [Serratia rubidaea]|nr:Uncharacterised protein [Serratia rubidaea]